MNYDYIIDLMNNKEGDVFYINFFWNKRRKHAYVEIVCYGFNNENNRYNSDDFDIDFIINFPIEKVENEETRIRLYDARREIEECLESIEWWISDIYPEYEDCEEGRPRYNYEIDSLTGMLEAKILNIKTVRNNDNWYLVFDTTKGQFTNCTKTHYYMSGFDIKEVEAILIDATIKEAYYPDQCTVVLKTTKGNMVLSCDDRAYSLHIVKIEGWGY